VTEYMATKPAPKSSSTLAKKIQTIPLPPKKSPVVVPKLGVTKRKGK